MDSLVYDSLEMNDGRFIEFAAEYDAAKFSDIIGGLKLIGR